MAKNTLLGYHVKSGEQFIHRLSNNDMYISYGEHVPISLADAHRRVADFIETQPEDFEQFGVPQIVPVHRALTPMEKTAADLRDRLKSLCSVHGLELGLSDEQIDRQIAKELTDLGAKS